jgi:hypothetical protein
MDDDSVLADQRFRRLGLRRIEANPGRSLAVPDELAELCLACGIRENMPAP